MQLTGSPPRAGSRRRRRRPPQTPRSPGTIGVPFHLDEHLPGLEVRPRHRRGPSTPELPRRLGLGADGGAARAVAAEVAAVAAADGCRSSVGVLHARRWAPSPGCSAAASDPAVGLVRRARRPADPADLAPRATRAGWRCASSSAAPTAPPPTRLGLRPVARGATWCWSTPATSTRRRRSSWRRRRSGTSACRSWPVSRSPSRPCYLHIDFDVLRSRPTARLLFPVPGGPPPTRPARRSRAVLATGRGRGGRAGLHLARRAAPEPAARRDRRGAAPGALT